MDQETCKTQNEAREQAKKEYINLLESDYTYSISQFDNQVLYLSSGAFALSLTFLKDIAPIGQAKYLWLFIIAMGLFTTSILLSFFSHFTSYRLIRKRIRYVQDNKSDIKEDKVIPVLNIIMVISLIFGIIVLVTFSSINFYAMNDNNSKDPVNTERPLSPSDLAKVTNKGMPVRLVPQAVTAAPATSQTPTTSSQTPSATSQDNQPK